MLGSRVCVGRKQPLSRRLFVCPFVHEWTKERGRKKNSPRKIGPHRFGGSACCCVSVFASLLVASCVHWCFCHHRTWVSLSPPQKKDTNEKGPSWLHCIAFHNLLIELHKPTYLHTYIGIGQCTSKRVDSTSSRQKGHQQEREREPLCHTTRQQGQVLVGRAWPGFFLPHIHSRHAIASKI